MSKPTSATMPPVGDMIAGATARFQRVSPRKARLLIDLIRGLSVAEARRQLMHQHRPSGMTVVRNVLNSAAANALEKREEWEGDKEAVEGLIIGEAMVDSGPTMKRFRPRAMGRASTIRKRMSHVTIKLYEPL